MPHGVRSSWRRNWSPVTVPRASGENPGQDDPDAAGVLDLDSGPEMGTSPGSSNGPEPGRRPCPGTPWHGAGRRGPDHQGAGGYGCPGPSVLCLGITLSDARGEGERAHGRRSERLPGVCSHPVRPSITSFLPPAGGGEGTAGGGAVDDVAGSGPNVSRPPSAAGLSARFWWAGPIGVSRRSRPGAGPVKHRVPFWARRKVWDQEA